MARVFEGMYIGGGWAAARATFKDLNPADGSVWAEIPDSGRAETAAAIEAAHAAFPEWSKLPFSKRAHYLHKAAEIWERRRMEIVDAIMAEGGGWFGKGMFETGYVTEIFHAAAGSVWNPIGEVMPSDYGKVSMAVRRPMGVVSVISPWNFPCILTARGFLFPLAAGNTIVLKPSEETPYLGGLLFAEIFEEAGLPKGVFNVVTCSRENVGEVGDELIEHPYVKGISFTGSTAVGRHIMRAAAENLTPVTLELGGKSPVIIGEDYPLAWAAERIVWGKLFNSGQICIAPDYVMVPQGKEREFSAYAQAAARKLYPKLAGNDDYTAVINDQHYQRLADTIADAKSKGAVVEQVADPAASRSERKLPFTVVLDPSDDMKVLQDEIFGPVLPVKGYQSVDDAISYVNEHPRPLALYVFSNKATTQEQVLAQTTSGGVAVNDTLMHYMQDDMPFGGVGPSGMGSYHTGEGFDTFSHLKPVFKQRGVGSFTGAKLLYPPYGPVTDVLLKLMRKI